MIRNMNVLRAGAYSAGAGVFLGALLLGCSRSDRPGPDFTPPTPTITNGDASTLSFTRAATIPAYTGTGTSPDEKKLYGTYNAGELPIYCKEEGRQETLTTENGGVYKSRTWLMVNHTGSRSRSPDAVYDARYISAVYTDAPATVIAQIPNCVRPAAPSSK